MMNYIELPFVKMSADAVTPTRATAESAGLDFYSPADYTTPWSIIGTNPDQTSNSSRILWQTSLKVWLGHIAPTTCGSRSHRP